MNIRAKKWKLYVNILKLFGEKHSTDEAKTAIEFGLRILNTYKYKKAISH